jgi:hypothetical protein
VSGGVPVRRKGRRVRIFGIDVKKDLAWWAGGRYAIVGDGVGVKSGDDERDCGVKTLESSRVGSLGAVSSSSSEASPS